MHITNRFLSCLGFIFYISLQAMITEVSNVEKNYFITFNLQETVQKNLFYNATLCNEENEKIGFSDIVFYKLNNTYLGSIDIIKIKKKYRNKGLGSLFLSKIISFFENNNNCTLIMLYAQTGKKPWLVDWYRKYGFKVDDNSNVNIQESVLVKMTKTLALKQQNNRNK